MTNNNLKPVIKERPILFSSPMVRAILEGRKTQTRRVVHPRFIDHIKCLYDEDSEVVRIKYEPWANYKGEQMPPEWILYSSDDSEVVAFHVGQLFGAPGDILWVRESFNIVDDQVVYAATPETNHQSWNGWKWKPSIHMPRWASRINLKIKNISIEHLQDISNADAMLEAIVQTWGDFGGNPPQWAIDSITDEYGSPGSHLYDNRQSKENYRFLWESINGKGSWDVNPWIWKIEFKRV